jgi:CheY-like chemotaxis protein
MKRVLVVDDDEGIRDFLKDSLEMQGYTAYSSTNGADALQFLEQNDVDLVLADVRMPEIGGVALAQKIHELRSIPVVLITGVHRQEREELLVESGAMACLPKPLRIQHLCDVLEQVFTGQTDSSSDPAAG